MPLNLSATGEEFTPYLKYNAKAGRFYVRPKGAPQDVEVEKPRLAIDMANIKTGWIFYPEGGAPEKVWDPSQDTPAARPQGPKKFKRGFEVMVFGNDNIPGIGPLELREFSSTASNAIAAILKMHAEYEAGAKQHPTSIPFYRCISVTPVQGAYGTNYEPVFQLMGWVERIKVPAFDDYLTRGDAREPAHNSTHANGGDGRAGNGSAPGYGAPTGGPPKGHPADLSDAIPFAASMI